jgi:hypothetical protein
MLPTSALLETRITRTLPASIVLVLAAVAVCAPAAAAPLVPGFIVESYATPTSPGGMSFRPDGTLFTGNIDNAVSGAFVQRVAPGGAPVTPHNATPIYDPDTAIYTANAFGAAAAGAVIVGGTVFGTFTGTYSAIDPVTGAVTPAFGAGGSPQNPSDMKFDSTGRLLIANFGSVPGTGTVLATTGGTPAPLISYATVQPNVFDVGANDELYVVTYETDGSNQVRRHAADGSVIDDSFVTGLGVGTMVDYSAGGVFGTGLLVLDPVSGVLRRFDDAGVATVLGTGFTDFAGRILTDIELGPGGALFLALADTCACDAPGEILRIAPAVAQVPEPTTLGLLGLMFVGLAASRRRRGGRPANHVGIAASRAVRHYGDLRYSRW